LARAGAAVGLLGHVDHHVLAAVGATGVPMVVAPTDFASRDEVHEAVAFAAGRLGRVDALVLAAADPVAFEPRTFAEVDDAHFEAVWEATMQATLFCFQAAYAHMAGRGGSIVVAVPTVAMSGMAGFAPYAAAAEGQRVLAKSAARQWGAEGITVNCLAVAPELVMGEAARADQSLAGPALGRAADAEEDLGPVVAFLSSAAGRFVTGATICVDGGVWMAP
jgi:NAD(P)-dependent dehydrogenase (short-subunit alcohol dehydrogenase family)